jgi:hypothetical protein
MPGGRIVGSGAFARPSLDLGSLTALREARPSLDLGSLTALRELELIGNELAAARLAPRVFLPGAGGAARHSPTLCAGHCVRER